MSEIVPTGPGALAPGAALQPDQNPAVVYLETLNSAASKRAMRAALNAIADLLEPRYMEQFEAGDKRASERYRLIPWHLLRYQHTAAIRARLVESDRAPATVNKFLCALRGTLREAWKLGLMPADEYQQARAIRSIDIDTLPSGRDIGYGEVQALAAVCKRDNSPAGKRDLAMLALLYAGGLRRAELVKLDLADVQPDNGRIAIRGSKRRKDRTLYVTGGALTSLERWLAVRGTDSGPLFVRIRKGGKLTGERLTTQAVYTILNRRARAAGVEPFSPHDFRRTFAGTMLDNGVDIATVANIMGHGDVNTTRRYDRRPEEVKRQAASKVHFPG